MKTAFAQVVVWMTALAAFGANVDPVSAVQGTPNGFGTMSSVIQQGGLVSALLVAVWYLAKLSNEKDKALYTIMTTMLQSNTEALVAQKIQTEDLSRLMGEVKERLAETKKPHG